MESRRFAVAAWMDATKMRKMEQRQSRGESEAELEKLHTNSWVHICKQMLRIVPNCTHSMANNGIVLTHGQIAMEYKLAQCVCVRARVRKREIGSEQNGTTITTNKRNAATTTAPCILRKWKFEHGTVCLDGVREIGLFVAACTGQYRVCTTDSQLRVIHEHVTRKFGSRGFELYKTWNG